MNTRNPRNRNRSFAKLVLAGLIASGALATTQAARADDMMNWGNATPWNAAPWYVGINLGQSRMSDIGNGFSKHDDTDTTGTVNIGYQFNRNFAVELGYTDFGKFNVSNGSGSGDWKSDGVGLSLVGILPMDNRWSLYGKIGAFYSDTRINNIPGVNSDKRTNGTAGLGVSYDFGNRVVGKAEWNYYNDVGESSTGKPTINTVTLGLAYRF